jgi:glycine betaine/choline ABC-type transport system substrate-binding protein
MTDAAPALGRREALLLLAGGALALAGCGPKRDSEIVVGSKNFTEQYVLGELLAQQIEAHTPLRVDRRLNLGGTFVCHQALLAGQLDLYVEYTGTALTAILGGPVSSDPPAVYQAVRDGYRSRFSLEVGAPLGFDNTFAIVVRQEDARQLGLRAISDLARVAQQWRAGFGYEFMERSDGYAGLAKAYGLRFGSDPRIMDLGLLYRALAERQVDVVAGNSTDGQIAALGMVVLEDDRHYFPPYQAVIVARTETLGRHADLRAALDALGGKISDDEMRGMNYAVDGQHRDPASVVREFRAAHAL